MKIETRIGSLVVASLYMMYSHAMVLGDQTIGQQEGSSEQYHGYMKGDAMFCFPVTALHTGLVCR